nr:LytTR family DNA-binding domain-containing protein [Luteibacter sp. Sphag1AF]
MRVLLVDDEAPARDKLTRYLMQTPGVDIVAEASTGAQALTQIRLHRPDVVFLDIGLPDMDGFDVLGTLGESLPAEIVFVTAHGDHALRAFDVHAFDYLLKPVSPERFDRLMKRLMARVVPAGEMGARIDGLLDALPTPDSYASHLLVERDEQTRKLPVASVERIEADRNYLVIHGDGGPYRLRGTVERMQARLDPAQFVRINRSTLIRLGSIVEVAPWPGGEYRLVLSDGARVTWTKRYLEAMPSALVRHL